MELTTENMIQVRNDWDDYLDYYETMVRVGREPETFKELYGYEIRLCKGSGYILEGERFEDI